MAKTPASSKLHHTRDGRVRLSLVWLLPLAALLACGYVLWQSYAQRGPLVEITFDNAGGVSAGETRVRRNDVDVGRVEAVNLADDLNSVVVSVRMDPQVAPYMNSDTRFWIVNAQINTTEISGLGTLLSGSFIEVDWDGMDAERTDEFVGLKEPPLTERGTPGLRLTLAAEEAGYIYVGSPVFLRQVEVGRVERRQLSEDATQVLFDIFIEAPFHENVYPATRFYGVSGVEGSVGAEGASVRVESIAALFTGGIAFENPPEITNSDPVTSNAKRFKLFDSRSVARDSIFDGETDQLYRFMATFDGSVKGLRRGATIEYNGLKVGQVNSVSVTLPKGVGDPGSAVVVMQFQPSRLGFSDITRQEWHDTFSELVANGMRVQLTTGNLLTGTLIVKMVSKPDLVSEAIDFESEPYPSIPVIESNVEAVTADVETLVKNLSELPLNTLVVSATQLLNDTRQLIASPDIAALPAQLSTTMAAFAEATSDLPDMVRSLTSASENANDVLEGLSPDSEIYIELSAAARELRIAAKSIAAFAELLEENPSAVFTGR